MKKYNIDSTIFYSIIVLLILVAALIGWNIFSNIGLMISGSCGPFNDECGGGGGYTPPPKPQCSDGIDNDGDNFIDAEDPGCFVNGVYSSTRNSESNSPLPQLQLKTIVKDCAADCRDVLDNSPNSLCSGQLGSDWTSIGVDCENIDIDHIPDGTYNRTFDQVWDNSQANRANGWCEDVDIETLLPFPMITESDDMTVTCVKNGFSLYYYP